MLLSNFLGPKKKEVGIGDLEDKIYDIEYERNLLIKKMEGLEKEIMREVDQLAEADGFKTEVIVQNLAIKHSELELSKVDFAYFSDILAMLRQTKAMKESEIVRGKVSGVLSKREMENLDVELAEAAKKRKEREREVDTMRNHVARNFSKFTSSSSWREDLEELRSFAESMQNARAKGGGEGERESKKKMYEKLHSMFAGK
jgi:hypothetical protein